MGDHIATPDGYHTGQEATRWDHKSTEALVRGWGREGRRQSDVSAYSRAKRKCNTHDPDKSCAHFLDEHVQCTYVHAKYGNHTCSNVQ